MNKHEAIQLKTNLCERVWPTLRRETLDVRHVEKETTRSMDQYMDKPQATLKLAATNGHFSPSIQCFNPITLNPLDGSPGTNNGCR